MDGDKSEYMKPECPRTTQTKRQKRGIPYKPQVDSHDHQPSSSTVGAVDATLAAGDGERISAPLRFDPFPFGIR